MKTGGRPMGGDLPQQTSTRMALVIKFACVGE